MEAERKIREGEDSRIRAMGAAIAIWEQRLKKETDKDDVC
jgi:hypothetical protein